MLNCSHIGTQRSSNWTCSNKSRYVSASLDMFDESKAAATISKIDRQQQKRFQERSNCFFKKFKKRKIP